MWYRGPDGMSNGLGDSSHGLVANVMASVLPYMAVGCCIHIGLGMPEGVAVQRGVDIGPQVIDLC